MNSRLVGFYQANGFLFTPGTVRCPTFSFSNQASCSGVQGVSRLADHKRHVRGCSQRFAGGAGLIYFLSPNSQGVQLYCPSRSIKFGCLSHLLVPGDLEEQEQRPNLDPRRRRRLKISQKTPDYLHLQYLTIYFPVPLKRVFIYPPSKLMSQAAIFHAVRAPYSICRNCCK